MEKSRASIKSNVRLRPTARKTSLSLQHKQKKVIVSNRKDRTYWRSFLHIRTFCLSWFNWARCAGMKLCPIHSHVSRLTTLFLLGDQILLRRRFHWKRCDPLELFLLCAAGVPRRSQAALRPMLFVDLWYLMSSMLLSLWSNAPLVTSLGLTSSSSQVDLRVNCGMTRKAKTNEQRSKCGKSSYVLFTPIRSNLWLLTFFCLMAAWLNEGRCPGGRPSVSTN